MTTSEVDKKTGKKKDDPKGEAIDYPKFDYIKKYKDGEKSGALVFLKEFYKDVWGKYYSYVENDKKLYDIFKKEHDACRFINEARVGLLNSMYGTRITNIRKIVEIIRGISSEDRSVEGALEKVGKFKDGNQSNQDEVRYEISFFSKYWHWYFEVTNKKEAQPIYDKNVKEVLHFYKSGEEPLLKSKSTKSYQKVKKAVDDFITKLGLGQTPEEPIKLELEEEYRIEGLPNEISMYRLVDKFLWLSYKLENGQIENQKMIDAYEKLKNELEGAK